MIRLWVAKGREGRVIRWINAHGERKSLLVICSCGSHCPEFLLLGCKRIRRTNSNAALHWLAELSAAGGRGRIVRHAD